MLTAVIGATGMGKTTTARQLAQQTGAEHVSAGHWIRLETGRYDHGKEAAAFLAEESRRRLAEDPLVASRVLAEYVECRRDDGVIIEGVRNPTDLLYLLRPGDAVLDLGGAGLSEWERVGLAACRALRSWAEQMDVTWTEMRRYFVSLPSPLPVYVARRWLYGGADQAPCGADAGHLIALECYPGSGVTATFRAKCGGVFHDVPLAAFCRHPCVDPEVEVVYRLPKTGHCYAAAGQTTPVFELPYGDCSDCWVHDRDRDRLGQGTTLGVLHWPEENELLHLVDLGGRLLLWPPHKLLFTLDGSAELPDWKKLRGK
jgi:hypothetical protein